MLLDFTVVDAETTGRSNLPQDITEISAIRYRQGQMISVFTTFVKAENSILPFVEELTGIEDGMLVDAPRIDQVIEFLVDFIGQDVVLGHDVDFDYGLINKAYEEKTGKRMNNPRIDTLALAQCLIQDSENHKLETLCHYFGVERSKGHRSLYDCKQTAEVYLKMLELGRDDKNECL